MIRVKQYVVTWRHRTLDTPDYPYNGRGFAWGKTRRQAIRNFFAPPFGMGHTAHKYEAWDAFRRNEIEVTEMRLCRNRP